MVTGDNGAAPVLDFVEPPDEVRPGDRVVSSGDGGLYPPDIVIGQVVVGAGRPAAGAARGRHCGASISCGVVRGLPAPVVEGPGGLIGPRCAAQPAAAAEGQAR